MSARDDRPTPHAASYLRRVQYVDASKLEARIALHQRFSTNALGWQRWHLDQIALAPGERVLEVGCGSGTLWGSHAERLPIDVALTLTDVSPGMLEAARTALDTAGVDARFEACDAQALPFDDDAFDVVVAAHMLYHVPDRPRALREMRRVLTPEGRAVIATNGRDHLRELDALLERHLGSALRDEIEFTLESGAAELETVFPLVARVDYDDGLRVTEAAALVDYILSMPGGETLGADAIQRLERDVAPLVAEPGGFEVTKSSGAFVCRG
ncbi:MAG: methyltransferase domain-containing protein [Planctomycetota bacterium]|nr:methyltransferase domain-containing protein [Planctomycetota bacterium]